MNINHVYVSSRSTKLDILCYIEYLIELSGVLADIKNERKIAHLRELHFQRNDITFYGQRHQY